MQFKQAGQFIINRLTAELPAHLTYHCVGHTLDVFNAAAEIGRDEGVQAHDMQLLLTAAWFHDTGFFRGPKDHEEESCRIAAATLPQFGYTAHDIEKINGMIMATRLPQTPHNHMEQILADADLDYLGRDDFYTIGEKLYQEFTHFGIVHNDQEWNALQERFLQNHHYFTKTAIKLRQELKQLHLQQVKAKLNS